VAPPDRRREPGSPIPWPTALVAVFERAQRLGFLGRAPVTDHLAHASAFLAAAPAAPAGTRCADLGSGAGLPGLPLAVAWPASRWWLLESSERRCTFLEGAVAELDLTARVEVVLGTAEAAGRGPLRAAVDRVVARAFGPPAVAAECGAPLLAVGGLALVSEPPGSTGERWAGLALTDLGLRLVRVVVHQAGAVAVLEQQASCPDRYPRRAPRRRPLF
jgi:16S rRNA (guanine527-N7)-methyltransferase